MRKKCIIFLSPSKVFYGAENSLFWLVKNINKEKFEPIIVVPYGCDYKHKFSEIGVKTEEVNFVNRFNLLSSIKIIKANFQIINIIKRSNAALVHVNLINHIESLFIIFCYALLKKKKIISHIRTHFQFSAIERLLIFRGYVVCVSKAIETQLLKRRVSDLFTIPCSKRIMQIYNGRDLSKFISQNETESLKKEFNLNGQKVVGIVSAIDKKKRIELFLSIAKEIKVMFKDVRFMIVGDIYSNHPKHVAYKKMVMNITHALGLQNEVIFAGRRDNIQDFYTLFDVFVLTSSREPLGGVIIEAMAAGKPVVASAVDGNSELIVDGLTGFLIKSNSPIDYAKKIVYLLENAGISNKMGESGSERAHEMFDISKHVRVISDFYEFLFKT